MAGICLPFSAGLTVWVLTSQPDHPRYVTVVAVICWLRLLMVTTLQICQNSNYGYRLVQFKSKARQSLYLGRAVQF